MAIRRGARSIVVGGYQLRWLATGDDRWMTNAYGVKAALEGRRIGIVVQHASGRGQKLFAGVPVYREVRNVQMRRADGVIGTELHTSDETPVTPALVRRVIEYALRNGWTPAAGATDFVLSEEAMRPLL